jgi:uncharacterized protein
VVESCGGGLYAHRYSAERGFDNPSVYCADLRALVDGVAERITDRTPSPAVYSDDELRFAQERQTRDLLARLHHRHAGTADWDEAWRLLVRLDSDEAAASQLNALLAHPYVRTALRRALSGEEPADAGLLPAIAMAAAVRARAEAALTWDHAMPELHLPTLGTLRLPGPGRVEVRSSGGRVAVRRGPDSSGTGDPERWRPLRSWDSAAGRDGSTGPRLLVDDADPYRDCFPFPAAGPLSPDDLDAFLERLAGGCALLRERTPGWWESDGAWLVTTVTPLAPGAGLRLGAHGLGALGVAVDVDPAEFARALPRVARRARFAALKESADLAVPGSPAERLLDEADDWVGKASFWQRDPAGGAARRGDALGRAGRALVRLGTRPRRELTPNGAVLAGGLWTQWAEQHGHVARLAGFFRGLGVREGGSLLVHASLGGSGLSPDEVRDALLDVLGPDGTLVVPAFTPENSDTSSAHRARTAGMNEREKARFRASMPPFEPETTPCPGMGALAECVRTTPGAVRSAHPQTSFAGLGPRAAELLDEHDVTCHLGERSPLARLYGDGAQVLLLGVGFEVCSAFHLAEYRMNPARPSRTYRCVLREKGYWFAYEDLDLHDEDFCEIGRMLPPELLSVDQVAGKRATLFGMKEAVDRAVSHMAASRR